MKKLGFILCITFILALSSCGKTEDNNAAATPAPTQAENNGGSLAEATKAPTKAPTAAPTEAAPDVWVMEEAPAIRNSVSEEEKLTRQNAILEKGTLLFSDKTNKGYYPSDISWLKSAGMEDCVALVFACDDVTHGGWGVLGLNVKSAKGGSKQKDIAAFSDQPDKERLIVYSMEELLSMAKAEKPADITSFQLGVWNGGRIAGLYYLPKDVATELDTFLAEMEKQMRLFIPTTVSFPTKMRLRMQKSCTTICRKYTAMFVSPDRWNPPGWVLLTMS